MRSAARRPRAALSAAVVAALLLAGCGATGGGATAGRATGDGPDEPRTSTAPKVQLPQPDATFDYQLGGAYTPPKGVQVVARDRTAEPAPGRYDICYVNAFQTQPGAAADRWRKDHGELLLRDEAGALVVDEDWDEPLLDISTRHKRAALAEVVGRWIDGCADAGFDAVELDNLDSYERSEGLLDKADATAYARLLTRAAHSRGLAVAQKNTTDLLPERTRIGFDFAVVEECARYAECPDFARAYEGRVFDVEYERRDFDAACRTWGETLSITLRDRDVRPAGAAGHVNERC